MMKEEVETEEKKKRVEREDSIIKPGIKTPLTRLELEFQSEMSKMTSRSATCWSG